MFLGALAPRTELEDSMLGETADELKGNIKDLAAEQYNSAKEAGAHAFQTSDGNDNDGTEKDSGAVLSDDEQPTQRDAVTLAPADAFAMGERLGQPPASNPVSSDAPAPNHETNEQ
jgi:hypothetical protein